MLPTIFIIIGVILTAFGVFGLLRIAFEPIHKAIEVVFLRRDDHVFYETGVGKQLLERESRILVIVCVVMIVVGLFFLGFGLTFKYGSRGYDSLLSENNSEGISEGDSSSNNPLAQGMTSSGKKYISEDGKEYSYFIRITGNDIFFNNASVGNVEQFEEYIVNVDRNIAIYIIDDFASSGTYHSVKGILDKYGMTYESEEE